MIDTTKLLNFSPYDYNMEKLCNDKNINIWRYMQTFQPLFFSFCIINI